MHKILIFSVGALGDTIASLPAINIIRQKNLDAHITLLTDAQKGNVPAESVLNNSGLIDEVISYRVNTSIWTQLIDKIRLLMTLRFGNYESLFYLAPSRKTIAQVRRDRSFFKIAGIREIYGIPKDEAELDYTEKPLPELTHETDIIIERLIKSGLKMDQSGISFDMHITDEEAANADTWLIPFENVDNNNPMIAIGIGSKMPAKIWPYARYLSVVKKLIREYDAFPILFGGGEDKAIGDSFIKELGRGANAAGQLSVRESCHIMSKSKLYLGNDTGTMHLAVCANLKCVAIFSARDFPGKWYPYGKGHHIFRKTVDCEGCMLEVCTKQRMKCILLIDENKVYQKCESILDQDINNE